MDNGRQGNSSQGGGSTGSAQPAPSVPDIIATPPPSRDHLQQLVFPDVSADEVDNEG